MGVSLTWSRDSVYRGQRGAREGSTWRGFDCHLLLRNCDYGRVSLSSCSGRGEGACGLKWAGHSPIEWAGRKCVR